MALKDKTVPDDFTPNPRVVQAIEGRLADGKLACASAFAVVYELEVPPLTVGRTADALEVRLHRCQLGLFGYPGKHGWDESNAIDLPVPPRLREAMDAAQDEEGHLSCAEAWELASKSEATRMQVGYLAEQMGIKITPCQLGAF